jgi:serine/threonine protein kinase/Tol biopolymer transport system component
MSLPPGTKLGPYEIQSLIGAGGMGEVYRARDTRLQRDVAIKILPSSLADQDRLRRFELEARAVAALNHPNLLTVFDVGAAQLPNAAAKSGAADTAAESPYIVSELLEGTTLRQLLAAGAMRERKAVDYAIQIARGLAAAHERGIVHRDLKPDNIFITDDGRAKILDFGLAKLSEAAAKDADATLDHPATQAGVVLGTVGYMSPEQVRGQAADARSDIFSFGAVLYEMLGGKRAFHGQSAADVMSAILKEEPPELSATNHEISPALDHIVHHCMEKNPQQRFASAGDIAFQLGEMSGLRSSTNLAAVAAVPSSRRFPTWAIAAAGALALVSVSAAGWFLARATAHTEPPNFLQVSFQQGSVDSARFLPDGQSFISASRWGTDIDMSLYTGRFDSQGLRPLGVKADAIASVSESGELLILQNTHRVGPGYAIVGTLARAPLGGGAPRAVLDNVQYADWAPGGKDFLIVRFMPETHSYRLEYPVGKVVLESAGWFSDPRFSRDGKTIAFLDHPIFGDDQGSAAVVDLQGRKTTLSGSYGSAQGVAWSPKSDEIWFAAAANGVARSLYATTLRGRVRLLLTGPGDLTIQDVLPNGRALVRGMNERIIVMVTTPEFPQPRDFTAMDWAYGARFSSDSKQILIGDQHSSAMYGTFLRNLDGSPAVRLGDGDPMDLSADGKWAITRLPVSPDQILLLPTGAGEPRQLTHTNVTHLDARWLPDGRIVAVGNEPGHRERTFLVDLKGNESPLTPEGVRALAASPDGKRLLVFNADASEYQMFPMDGGAAQKATQLQKGDSPFDFTADGAGIFVRRQGANREVEIWRIELASGKRTLLRTITPGEVPAITRALGGIISPDGKSFAMTYVRELSTEFVVEGLK